MIKQKKEKPIKNFKFIHKIGCELEGGWETMPLRTVAGDSSVMADGEIRGEIRTEPKRSLKEFIKEIDENYPTDVDESCGFHIHISIEDKYLPTLMGKEFFNKFYIKMGHISKEIRNSGNKDDYKHFLNRYSGKNSYCSKNFMPIEQISGKTSERRTMINFCSYRTHKTIENRMLPMFTSRNNARIAASEYAMFVENYIKENYTEEKKLKKLVVEV